MSIFSVSSLLAFLLPLTGVIGWSAYNQPCSTYHDAIDSCDPYAFLTCERSLLGSVRSIDYICKCSSPDYIWSGLVGRCTLRVGSNCLQGPLGRGLPKYPDCPPSSSCDIRSSNTCKCHTNHVSNADGSACNKGNSVIFRHTTKGSPLSFWLQHLTTLSPTLLWWGLLWLNNP
ncbi:hypothetical protein Fcan01_08211 [Folsomia candida]|uniref:Uncharacterized protein n=1 Tax=Folsomia candida TaxID=158441 RepID=A0A226EMR5_FOLCA|nr:hypothetical protein Fcan01_08211 [Folsomia candida]